MFDSLAPVPVPSRVETVDLNQLFTNEVNRDQRQKRKCDQT